MHIPDGYLGPATCGVFYAVMLPIWTVASKIVKKTLKADKCQCWQLARHLAS